MECKYFEAPSERTSIRKNQFCIRETIQEGIAQLLETSQEDKAQQIVIDIEQEVSIRAKETAKPQHSQVATSRHRIKAIIIIREEIQPLEEEMEEDQEISSIGVQIIRGMIIIDIEEQPKVEVEEYFIIKTYQPRTRLRKLHILIVPIEEEIMVIDHLIGTIDKVGLDGYTLLQLEDQEIKLTSSRMLIQ